MRQFKIPRDNQKYRWTNHVVRKMMHYRLTPSRVMRIVRAPERLEAGVADGCVAGMQRTGSRQKPAEIWAMWREEQPKTSGQKPSAESRDKTGAQGSLLNTDRRKVIITAWRYPGVSPVRDAVPIPEEVMSELQAEGLIDGS